MLKSLSGRDHQVITAVALSFADQNTITVCDVCNVHFYPFGEDILRSYVGTGECDDKAGAYAIQGQGAFLVAEVRGSWSNVVGLPVTRLAALLLEQGWIRPSDTGTPR